MSTETPRKLVPSFDHLVTQWMSHGTVLERERANSSQLHSRSSATMPSIRKATRRLDSGVGPAVSTGKPLDVLAGRQPLGELLRRAPAGEAA